MKLGLGPWTAVPIALAVTTLRRPGPRVAVQPTDRHLLPDADAHLRRDRLLLLRTGHDVLRLRRHHRHRSARVLPRPARCACTTPRSPSRCSPTSDSVRSRRTPFGMALRVSATIRSGWRRSASTSRSTARWRSPWPGSWPALAGVLNIWWNGQIDPNSIAIGADARPVHHRRDRRHQPPRRRLARSLRVRRRQHLPARPPVRRSPRGSPRPRVQHRRRGAASS